MSAKGKRTLTLEFPDNKLLVGLGGAHEKNFARLVQKLNVKLSSRGNLIVIEGEDRKLAVAILKSLYARLKAGEDIILAEIDSELRFIEAPRDVVSDDVRGGTIRTAAWRVTRRRPPAQSTYLDLMKNCPLVFGVGPSGTGKTYLAATFTAHMLQERRGTHHPFAHSDRGRRLQREDQSLPASAVQHIARFFDSDVVRHALVGRIVAAYNKKARQKP